MLLQGQVKGKGYNRTWLWVRGHHWQPWSLSLRGSFG